MLASALQGLNRLSCDAGHQRRVVQSPPAALHVRLAALAIHAQILLVKSAHRVLEKAQRADPVDQTARARAVQHQHRQQLTSASRRAVQIPRKALAVAHVRRTTFTLRW